MELSTYFKRTFLCQEVFAVDPKYAHIFVSSSREIYFVLILISFLVVL